MELTQDVFEIHFDSQKVDPSQILAACKHAGFPATIVRGPSALKEDSAGHSNETELVAPQFFSDALKTAAQQDKPIVLDFMASWCAPCQRLDDETFNNPVVAELLEKCVLLKVDTDEFPELARHYEVSSLPDIRLLLPDGTPQGQLTGFQDTDTMSIKLRELLDHRND